jgi:hypothetical protein
MKPRKRIKVKEVTTLTDKDKRVSEVKLTTYSSKFVNEPIYYKCYEQHIYKLDSLTINQRRILDNLLFRMEYDNVVRLDTTDRIKIIDRVGVSSSLFNQALSRLRKLTIMKAISHNKYFIDPQMFAKGSFAEILKTQKLYTAHKDRENKKKNVS